MGFPGVQGSQGPIGYRYLTNMGTKAYASFTNPQSPVSAVVSGSAIYLQQPSSYYVISFSVETLGDAYIPSPFPTSPGNWNIYTIYAGVKPLTGLAPINKFDLSQLPVTLFFQNVGGVPVRVNFGNNDSRTNVTYISLGSGPNATPSSFLIEPLGILIIEAVFTNLNVIRLYNSFLDSLNPNRFYRIADRAAKLNYLSPARTASPLLTFTRQITINGNITLKVLDLVNSYSQNIVTGYGDITLDGTDAPPLGISLLTIRPSQPIKLTLINLVNSRNYKGQLVPSVLQPVDNFLAITGTRVVNYDAGSGIASAAYNSNSVSVLTYNVDYTGSNSPSITGLDTKVVSSASIIYGTGLEMTLKAGTYQIFGSLTADSVNPSTTYIYELTSNDSSSVTVQQTEGVKTTINNNKLTSTISITPTQTTELIPTWNVTLSESTTLTVQSTGSDEASGTWTVTFTLQS